jgi:chorismate mutase/prephenate dehydratase
MVGGRAVVVSDGASTVPAALAELRSRVDVLDAQLVELLAERLALASDIAAAKRAGGRPLRDAAREAEVLRRCLATAPRAGGPAMRRMMAAVVQWTRLHQVAAVSVLGPAGSFSDRARHAHFPGSRGVFAPDFAGVIAAVLAGEADAGLVPVYADGPVAAGVAAVAAADAACVEGVVESAVEIHLLTLREAPLARLRTLHSRPEVFRRCGAAVRAACPDAAWVEAPSTSAAAAHVAAAGDPTAAALAGAGASGLRSRGVVSPDGCVTRFAVITAAAP